MGKHWIGVAVSDELRITAQGLATIERKNLRTDLERIAALTQQLDVSLIVLGNPLHMSGAEGAQSAWVREFAEKLRKRIGIDVDFWDERLTTVEAERVLRDSGISAGKRGRAVDRLAAVILLESYLGALAQLNASEPVQ